MEISEIGSDSEKGCVGGGGGRRTQARFVDNKLPQLNCLAVSLVGYMALGKSLNGRKMCPGFESEDSILLLQTMR